MTAPGDGSAALTTDGVVAACADTAAAPVEGFAARGCQWAIWRVRVCQYIYVIARLAVANTYVIAFCMHACVYANAHI